MGNDFVLPDSPMKVAVAYATLPAISKYGNTLCYISFNHVMTDSHNLSQTNIIPPAMDGI